MFLGYSNFDSVYDVVLMTGKGTFVVGKQQMVFDYYKFLMRKSELTDVFLTVLTLILSGTFPGFLV